MVDISFTMILQALNFGALVLFLYHVLFKPLVKFLDERSAEIKNDLDSAKEKKAEAGELLKQYEDKLKNLQLEAEKFMENTRQEAAFEREKVLRAAENEAAQLLDRTRKEIRTEMEVAKAELKKDFSKTAIFCAEKIIEKEIDEDRHKEIINQFIESEFV